MNSNLFHNVANVVMAVLALGTAVLLAVGCTTLPGGDLECSQSFLSPTLATSILSGLAVLKLLVNVVRDGVGGLTKPQPPVDKG